MDEKELREIERMVRDYYPKETASSECIQDSIAKGGYANIVALYNKGYRKVPEGAVVLSKEEYDELLMDWDKKEQGIKKSIAKDVLDSIQQAYNDGRKETAKEIFEKIRNEFEDRGTFVGFSIREEQVNIVLDDIAKEYGVEL